MPGNPDKKSDDFVFWLCIIIIAVGIAMAYSNRSKDEPLKPVPHSTISPEGVHDLP